MKTPLPPIFPASSTTRYSSFPISPREPRRVAAVLVALASVAVAAPTVVTDLEVSPTLVTLTFLNDGSSNQFTLQANLGLDAANWANAANATLTPLGGNRYTFTVPRTAADKRFFRIIGRFLGTGVDRDGDGLPNQLEESFTNDPNSPAFSDPDKFDTDGDGFNDGFEYASGTDPNDAADFPQNSLVPKISFAESQMIVQEGDGTIQLSLTADADSTPYTGPVSLTVTELSTATNGTDYLLGSASLSGTSGGAALSLVDNANLSNELRVLAIQIEDSAGNYLRGANFDTIIIIGDNDCYWSGVLRHGFSETSFRLRLIVTSGTPQFSFVAGSGFDGLPQPAGLSGSDQSTGIVPVGIHQATNVVFTAAEVRLTSPLLPVAQSSLFGADLELARVLELTAVDSAPDAVVTGAAIGGTYSESISDLSGNNPHLTILKSGTFAISRQIPAQPVLPALFAND